MPDETFGYVLHPADLAMNMVMAAAGRRELRDIVDLITVHERILFLGAVIWAAVEKSPSFTPEGLIADIRRNANYPDASTPLSTTIRDARTLADEFRRSEFDVDLKEDLTKEQMQRAIDTFTGKIQSGTAALFYFNGYGLQVGRQTYLVPVNAQMWTEADVRRDPLSVFPRVMLWAWERPEDLRFVKPDAAGIAFLARTLWLDGNNVSARPRLQPLRFAPGTPLHRCQRRALRANRTDYRSD